MAEIKKKEEKYKAIIAVANSVRNDGKIITEEAIRKASEMHKNLSVEKTDQGIVLVWTGPIKQTSD